MPVANDSAWREPRDHCG